MCNQCQRRDTECNYRIKPSATGFRRLPTTPSKSALEDDSAPYAATNFSAEACMGMHVFATAISRRVSQRSAAGLSQNSLAYMLQHFERTGYSTVSSPIGQRILHEKILRMLMSHSFLMHVVIAFSSSHLAYLSRDKPYYMDTVLTASYHTQRALHLYTHYINLHQRDHSYSRMDDSSALEEMDALFATSFLLKSLFFHVDEAYLPRKSWTITSTPVAHFGDQCDDWIGNTSGLNVVFSLKQFRAKLGQSIWRPFLEEVNRLNGHPSKEMNRLPSTSPSPQQPNLHNNFSAPSSTNTPTTTTSKVSSGISTTTIPPQTIHDTYPYPTTTNTLPNIPPHLLRLALSSPNLPIYALALTLLDPILALDPTNLNYFGGFIPFTSRLSPDFIGLLRRKQRTRDFDEVSNPDPIALLILGYWFDRIGQVPHWWCSGRGKGECVAILGWLRGKIGYDGSGSLEEGGMGWDYEGCMNSNESLFERAVEEFEERIGRSGGSG